MKKLNNNGFTLVELLSIIVILAIIIVVTVPSALSTIDNSKKGALEDSAKSIAKWLEINIKSDELITDPNKKQIRQSITTSWSCITEETAKNADINAAEYNIAGATAGVKIAPDEVDITSISCSMVKLNEHGRYNVILLVNPKGKAMILGKSVMYFDTEKNSIHIE